MSLEGANLSGRDLWPPGSYCLWERKQPTSTRSGGVWPSIGVRRPSCPKAFCRRKGDGGLVVVERSSTIRDHHGRTSIRARPSSSRYAAAPGVQAPVASSQRVKFKIAPRWARAIRIRAESPSVRRTGALPRPPVGRLPSRFLWHPSRTRSVDVLFPYEQFSRNICTPTNLGWETYAFLSTPFNTFQAHPGEKSVHRDAFTGGRPLARAPHPVW